MNYSELKIYAVNFHSFLFKKQINNDHQSIKISEEKICETCNAILKQFSDDYPDAKLKLRENISDRSSLSLVESEQELPEGVFESQKYDNRYLFIDAKEIDDSYVLIFDKFIKQDPQSDQIKLKDINQFNLNQCFRDIDKDWHKTFEYLGKTFIITAFLSEDIPRENYKEIADNCLHYIFDQDFAEIQGKFYQEGEIFNSRTFEYGRPKKDQFHALVIFFCSEESNRKFEQLYWKLPNLLLYHHKIIEAYQKRAKVYPDLDDKIINIEKLISDIDNKQDRENMRLSDQELEQYKITLKELLQLGLEYSRKLRDLEFYQNTIAINSHNYQTILNVCKEETQNELKFFTNYAQKEWKTLQDQIKADLNYFHQGTVILNQGIETIRGLIEVDQAKSDRIREENQIKRDRNLQITILAIGSGLAVGGIVATSYALVTPETPLLPPQFNHPLRSVSPFYKSVFLSIICAVVTYVLIKKLLKR